MCRIVGFPRVRLDIQLVVIGWGGIFAFNKIFAMQLAKCRMESPDRGWLLLYWAPQSGAGGAGTRGQTAVSRLTAGAIRGNPASKNDATAIYQNARPG